MVQLFKNVMAIEVSLQIIRQGTILQETTPGRGKKLEVKTERVERGTRPLEDSPPRGSPWDVERVGVDEISCGAEVAPQLAWGPGFPFPPRGQASVPEVGWLMKTR